MFILIIRLLIFVFFLSKAIPTLCFEVEFIAVARNEFGTKFGFSNMSNYLNILYLRNAFVVGKWHRKE